MVSSAITQPTKRVEYLEADAWYRNEMQQQTTALAGALSAFYEATIGPVRMTSPPRLRPLPPWTGRIAMLLNLIDVDLKADLPLELFREFEDTAKHAQQEIMENAIDNAALFDPTAVTVTARIPPEITHVIALCRLISGMRLGRERRKGLV